MTQGGEQSALGARGRRRSFKERTDIDICTTILGFIQRGGQPSAKDAILGSTLGAAAVKALLDGETAALVGMWEGKVRKVSYEDAKHIKKPFNQKLYDLAEMLGAAQVEGNIRESGL